MREPPPPKNAPSENTDAPVLIQGKKPAGLPQGESNEAVGGFRTQIPPQLARKLPRTGTRGQGQNLSNSPV